MVRGPSRRIEDLIERLGDASTPPGFSEKLWEELYQGISSRELFLTEGDRQDLLGVLKAEPVARVRLVGFVNLQLHSVHRTKPPRAFISALWEPFAPARRAAVIAVNDRAHVKD